MKISPIFISPAFHHLFCLLDLDKCSEGDLLTPFFRNVGSKPSRSY